MSMNRDHQRAYCSPSGDIMGMENHGGMISTKENSLFVHQSSLSILPAESSSSEQEERAKGMMNLALRSIFAHTSEVIFYTP
jgi:hypothetical protein